MPQCQFPFYCYFCVLEMLHRKYSQNWTKQKPKLLFFPDEGRRPKESQRGARGTPHQGVVRPPGRARGWWGPPGGPLMLPLRLFKVSWSPNPRSIDVFWEEVLQLHRHHRWISGDRSLYFGTLPGRESAPGAISINVVASSAVSIDFTAISTNVVVSYDDEGVVLPWGWGLYR
jgi:hypothetical protein